MSNLVAEIRNDMLVATITGNIDGQTASGLQTA